MNFFKLFKGRKPVANLPDKPAEPKAVESPQLAEPCQLPLNCGECKIHCCHNCRFRESHVNIELDGNLAFFCERETLPSSLILSVGGAWDSCRKRFKNGYSAQPNGKVCPNWRPRYPGNQVINEL